MVRNPIWWFLFFLLCIVGLIWAVAYQEVWTRESSRSSYRSTTSTNGSSSEVSSMNPAALLLLRSHQSEVSALQNFENESKDEAMENLDDAIYQAEKVEEDYPEFARDEKVPSWLIYLRGLRSKWNQNARSPAISKPSEVVTVVDTPKPVVNPIVEAPEPKIEEEVVSPTIASADPTGPINASLKTDAFPDKGLFSRSDSNPSEEPAAKARDDIGVVGNSSIMAPVVRKDPSISVPPPPSIVIVPQTPQVLVEREVSPNPSGVKVRVGENDNAAVIWFRAYERAELAKQFEEGGQTQKAIDHYQESMAWYQALIARFPNFQTDNVVKYKTLKLEDKIAELSSSSF